MKKQEVQIIKPHEKRGPKPKLLMTDQTLEQIRALGKIQATVDEAAAVLRVSRRTLFNFFEANEEAREIFMDGALEGKVSLRRKQFLMADKNPAMAIWLGKQYLGQHDRREVEIGKPGDFESLSDDSLQQEVMAMAVDLLGKGKKPAHKGNSTEH